MKGKKDVSDIFKNRSELDVLASMISGSTRAIKKTHIMYKSNLSYPQLKYYLAYMENLGLLKRIDGPNKKTYYRSTNLGRRFLKDYRKLMGYFK